MGRRERVEIKRKCMTWGWKMNIQRRGKEWVMAADSGRNVCMLECGSASLSLEILMFVPLGYGLSKLGTRCWSYSLHVALLW